jgi:prepilin-type N-terminal cleavage/methylation domain-containing protein
MNRSRRSLGFTLTELLVTLAIIIALAAIATPVGLSIRHNAQRAACLSNLRQIGVGLESYLQDHGDILPEWQPGRSSKLEPGPVLETDLLPYVGNPETFHCPADHKEFARSGSSYIWNTTQNGRRRTALAFFGTSGEAKKIPLITDKEGWHSGDPSVNFLYADLSASTKVQFGVNE